MLERVIEFILREYLLVGAWMTLVFLILRHEKRRAGLAVSPQKLADLVNRQQGMVIDIRDKNEFLQGHIVDALNIPFRDLKTREAEIISHKEKPIIIVCKLGQTSNDASKQLKDKGFNHVYVLQGGISEWKAVNFPLVK